MFKKDGWRITTQKYNAVDWPYIVHTCEDDPDSEFTPCIVLQAPMTKLSYPEYIKQMKCQICRKRPPDDVITLWTLMNWERM